MSGREQHDVETEFKLALGGGDELVRMRAALLPDGADAPAAVSQENHFFDDANGSLRRADCVLRLRAAGGRHVLTAKGPLAPEAEGAALSSKREVEAAVSRGEAEAVLAGERSPLDALADAVGAERAALLGTLRAHLAGDLRHVGSFRNERTCIGPLHLAGTDPGLRVTFELDRTELPGGRVDHELELEVEPEHAAACGAALARLLERAGVPWRPSTSKASRFFGALGSTGGSTPPPGS